MVENALFSTKTLLFPVLMPKAPPPPLEPIFLRRLHLRCGDWSVRSLRVNRHLQPFDHYAPHRHPHGQLLVYLRGYGEQRVGRQRHPVVPGAVFFIPPGRIHEFREQAPRRAICLVADLGGAEPRRLGTRHGRLSAEALADVRQQVASLSAESGRNLDLSAGGAALLILEICRRACTAGGSSTRATGAVLGRLQRVCRADEEGRWPRPGELARRVGLQKDYLNRLVRRSCGLTLGQWRDRELLRAAETLLRRGRSITRISDSLGFNDSNYFARWFRRQTGLPPSHWQSG